MKQIEWNTNWVRKDGRWTMLKLARIFSFAFLWNLDLIEHFWLFCQLEGYSVSVLVHSIFSACAILAMQKLFSERILLY